MSENKRVAFKRLAVKRTNNLIKNIHLLGNLSNKRNYEFTESDYRHIFTTVEQEFKLAKAKFLVSLNKKRKFKI